MHSRIDFNTVFAVILALSVTPLFSWFAIKGLRTGSTGPKTLTVTRTANPALYWLYLSVYIALAVMITAFALFSISYKREMASEITMMALQIAIFCFGLSFAAMASVVGYYTVKGFRTGTSVVFGRGGPFISSRVTKPTSYWFDQLFNVLFTCFLGTFGFGGVGVALWFAIGASVLR